MVTFYGNTQSLLNGKMLPMLESHMWELIQTMVSQIVILNWLNAELNMCIEVRVE